MAKTIWNPQDRAALLARADSLTPDSRPQWGKMSVTQMLRHCTVPILATMGEYKVTYKAPLLLLAPATAHRLSRSKNKVERWDKSARRSNSRVYPFGPHEGARPRIHSNTPG